MPLLCRPAAATDPFLLVNGDTLTDLDLPAMLSSHAASGATVTMARHPNPQTRQVRRSAGIRRRLGDRIHPCRVGSTSRITSSESRSPRHEHSSAARGVPAETVDGIYPQLIASDRAAWRRLSATRLFATSAHRPTIWTPRFRSPRYGGRSARFGRAAEIHPSASVVRTAIWDDVKIGADAELVECIVCDGRSIPGGSTLSPLRNPARRGTRAESGTTATSRETLSSRPF